MALDSITAKICDEVDSMKSAWKNLYRLLRCDSEKNEEMFSGEVVDQ
ncbi:hypothetical protein J2S36_001685 [Arcanobacterium hippocoleae]|uniref:Uncharacterized protein n=1 Tax=Arcanobacterium hippocoleae TaxID=149017 RepID=A0ABU1T425_9ACTO|nr:hypothetical protein [Arcanobacterium hippocoleae]MDR6940142.1 hypothetical protein [Arcanobacterium hippocoleae]